MVMFQVILGGITRLTESGLSITKWQVVSGTLPPISETDWIKEFELYKETPQYKEINEGMSISQFKFIYFWEYVHRLWARFMGFVFLIPFLYFYYKNWIDTQLLKRLGGVILLTIFAASFGWIMVASGLVKRPWVNAYKLSIHLNIAFLVFAYLWWTYIEYVESRKKKFISVDNKLSFIMIMILWLQLFFGGIMSGMKAGVYFPTWPSMNGEYFPQVLFNINEWNVQSFNEYDRFLLLPTLIQFLHRLIAYTLFIYGYYVLFKLRERAKEKGDIEPLIPVGFMLITQVILGIITVTMCKGEVPVLWGVLHQAGALLLLASVLKMRYIIKN